MDTIDFTRFIFAFIFVIGLIGAAAMAAKKYLGTQKMFGMKEGGGRISVIETRYIDPRRKLVLIKRDNVEHLILLAGERELVVESNIAPTEQKL